MEGALIGAGVGAGITSASGGNERQIILGALAGGAIGMMTVKAVRKANEREKRIARSKLATIKNSKLVELATIKNGSVKQDTIKNTPLKSNTIKNSPLNYQLIAVVVPSDQLGGKGVMLGKKNASSLYSDKVYQLESGKIFRLGDIVMIKGKRVLIGETFRA